MDSIDFANEAYDDSRGERTRVYLGVAQIRVGPGDLYAACPIYSDEGGLALVRKWLAQNLEVLADTPPDEVEPAEQMTIDECIELAEREAAPDGGNGGRGDPDTVARESAHETPSSGATSRPTKTRKV
jgi:hypothetical protein